jgi:O-antigen/teichoic acid export membrane protein
VLIRSAAIFAFVWQGYGIITLGIIHLLSQVLTGVLLVGTSLREFPLLRFQRRYVSLESMKALYSYSFFILLNNLAMIFLFKSGALVAGMFISAAAVTYYSIADGLTQYLSRIIGTMTQVLHPYASAQDAKGDVEGIRTAVLVGTKICLIIALPISAAFILLGDRFIASWMGPSYAAVAAPLLTVLAVARVFWLAQSATGNILLGIGKHKFLTAINFATGVGSILGALACVRSGGLYGMVLGTSIPVLVTQGLVLPVYTCRTLRIPLRQYLSESCLRPAIATIPFALVLFALKGTPLPDTLPGFVASVLIAAPFFLLAATFFCFSSTERREYLRTLRSIGHVPSKEPS